MHEFNFDTKKWTDISKRCFGIIPEPRSRTFSTIYKNQMFLIGGWNKIGYFSDYFSFNFDSKKWTKLEISKFEIPNLSKYSSTIYENENGILNNVFIWCILLKRNENY